jgi:hypothetical protein
MASDLQMTNMVTGLKWKCKTKIYKFEAHPLTYSECDFMIGFCGAAGDTISIVEYFSMPDLFKPPRVRNLTQGLVLTANKEIFIFDDYTKWLVADTPYASVGSGSAVAIGAMASGATPREAIKIASKHDTYTGLGTKVFNWNI